MTLRDLEPAGATPPPIVSDGTSRGPQGGVSAARMQDSHARQIFEAALARVPQEAVSDTMSIAPGRFRVIWRPNNYRRKIGLRARLDTGVLPVKYQYRKAICSSKGVWSIKGEYAQVTVMLGPRVLTAIWAQRVIEGKKETFLLESDSAEVLRVRVLAKTEEVRAQLDRVLVDVAERLRLPLADAEPIWDRYEDFVRDERIDELLSGLPSACVVHESFFKKVYEQGVEFVQSKPGEAPGVRLSTYLKNRAFEDVAPEVSAELAAMRRQHSADMAGLRKEIAALARVPEKSLEAAAKPGQKKLSRWGQ